MKKEKLLMPTEILVPGSDFNRIQQSLGTTAATIPKSQTDEILHKKSINRISTWTNTLEGQRKVHETERLERLAKEEQKRRMIDIEEAKIQLLNRQKAIEQANFLLYAAIAI